MKAEEFFKVKLEGNLLAAAFALNNLARTCHEQSLPIQAERQKLIEHLKKLDEQLEFLETNFDETRVAFFEKAEKVLCREMDAVTLVFENEGQTIFIQRSQEDLDRRDQLMAMRSNPINILRQALEGQGAQIMEVPFEEAAEFLQAEVPTKTKH